MTDEIKTTVSKMVTISPKKKNLLRRGSVFNTLFNIHGQMNITINRLGLVHNQNRLPIAKGYIVSKQILRTLRGDMLSSGLDLCVNVELGKVKIGIIFLGLMDSIIKAVCIRGPVLFQEGIGVTVFTNNCLFCLTELVLGIFYLFFLIRQDFFQRLHFFLKLFPDTLRHSKFFLHTNLPEALRLFSSSSVSLALFLTRSSVVSWFKHRPINPFIITIA